MSILRAIQRAILKPRFTLNRNERRSLERGLELNEKNIKTKYLKPTRR